MIEGGASNFSRAQVPWAFDLAAAWSWRILVVAAAVFGTLWLLSFFAVVVLPLLVALFASALLTPVVHWLMRIGAGRRIASLVVVIFSIAAVAAAAHVRRPADRERDGRPLQAGRRRRPAGARLAAHRSAQAQRPGPAEHPQGPAGLDRRRQRVRHPEPRHRGRRDGQPHRGRVLHRAVRHLLLPGRRAADLDLVRPALPTRRAASGRLLGPGRVALADPVRARDRAGGRHRRHRDHDRRRDPRRAVRAGDRRPGLPRCVRADDRRVRVRHRRRPGRAGRGRARSRRC